MLKIENRISPKLNNKVKIISKIIYEDIENKQTTGITKLALGLSLNEKNRHQYVSDLINKLSEELETYTGLVLGCVFLIIDKNLFDCRPTKKVKRNEEESLFLIEDFILRLVEVQGLEMISKDVLYEDDLDLNKIFHNSEFDYITEINEFVNGATSASMWKLFKYVLEEKLEHASIDKVTQDVKNKTIKWNGNNVELSELVKALIENGKFDSSLSQAEIFERFAKFFEFNLKETQGIKDFSKRSPEDFNSQQPYLTKFLDSLKDSLHTWHDKLEFKKNSR